VTVVDLRAADAPVRRAGIADLTLTDRGALTERLPGWARAQLVDPAIAFVSSMPSGGRLELVTDSTWLELEAVFTRTSGRGPLRTRRRSTSSSTTRSSQGHRWSTPT
jgi:hypothetical protein